MRKVIRQLINTIRSWPGLPMAVCLIWVAQSFGAVNSLPGPSAGRALLGGRPDFTWEQLGASAVRDDIQHLSPPAQQKANDFLRSFVFPAEDLPALRSDRNGGILYVCDRGTGAVSVQAELPPVGLATVPIAPFPPQLVFHTRPGSPNILYLNFIGATVTNSEWNTVLGRLSIPAVAFSTDLDFATFSDAEQEAIKRIWQRVGEDYAPFDIDVTTERPGTFNTRTAHALITRSTDANGDLNPYSTAGGVAYVNVFGISTYDKYRPAWIYYDNLASTESYIAEAAAHEVGHNLGLSHDGKTDGTEYYGGHGSGDISWGPIMGTGYNRNMSQWSQGDYYLANNTQDDTATLASKITYRVDDAGNTRASATALIVTGTTNVVSTTPESDPANTNVLNKGVIERITDVDVFSFVTGDGPVQLAVHPWIMPANTRGGNLDVWLELYNEAGMLLVTNDAVSQTTAVIATNLSKGRYYLQVRPSCTGNPLSSTPTGYTLYGSLGQYFISGSVSAVSNYIAPPQAVFGATNLVEAGRTNLFFVVTYSDDVAIDISTIDSQDIHVTGPNGYDQVSRWSSLNVGSNGTPRSATYTLAPSTGGVWSSVDNGTYTVFMQTNAVADTEGAFVAAGVLGLFYIAVPAVIYSARMDMDPGWTLDPQWQYGAPAYISSGPTGAFTGTKIVGYNLSGNYANNLSVKYATTPAIDTRGNSTLTLRFQRWLRTKSQDTVAIEVSTNATLWLSIWSTSNAVSDNAWQLAQYTLPAGVAGSSTVRLRWSIRSGPTSNDIGWNLDDVELLGDASMDVVPPIPAMNVSGITLGGSPSHSCSVRYTDDTAVRLSSLDSADLQVTGPNNYSNLADFAGSDLPDDGSPINVAYSIPAPGGTWSADDNGRYTVTLLDGAVEDTLNNVTPRTELGGFDVAISAQSPGILEVSPLNGMSSSGRVGGPFLPVFIAYTLTNSGESTLEWAVSKASDWVTLSTSGGRLVAGATTTLTVEINATAETLASGDYNDSLNFANASTGDGNTIRNIALTVIPPTLFRLSVDVNNSAWGSVNPPAGDFAEGTVVDVTATASNYATFVQWQGDLFGSNTSIQLSMDSNKTVQGVFGEQLTTAHPTPYGWLALYGFTNDFEQVAESFGSNQMPIWESYIASLNPNDPADRFVFTNALSVDNGMVVFLWRAASGRVYQVLGTPNVNTVFVPVEGATHLTWPTSSYTVGTTNPNFFYRLGVSLDSE